jgi:hypothetical protein
LKNFFDVVFKVGFAFYQTCCFWYGSL